MLLSAAASQQSPSGPEKPSSGKTTKHFVLLDALRGLAAMWVFIFHLEVSQVIPNVTAVLSPQLTTVLFTWGQYSVVGFFVLSGFVIAHSLRNTTVSWDSFKEFCQRRLARLTPPYYASIFLFLANEGYRTYLGWQDFPLNIDVPSALGLLSHLTFLQDILGFEHYNEAYWTICLEVQFYLSFILLLGFSHWLKRRFNCISATAWIFGIWTFICLLYNNEILGFSFSRPLFVAWQFSFLLGVYAYWSWQRRCHPAIGYGYIGLILVTTPISSAFTIAAVLSSSLILAAAQLNKLSSWLSHPILQFLGKISYSLYLTHTVASVFFYGYWLQYAQPTIAWELAGFLLCLGFGLILATAVYYIVEKPSIHWSRSLKTAPKADIQPSN